MTDDDKENLVNDEETIDIDYIERKLVFMKNKFINSDNDKNDIIIAMKETSNYRKDWIKKALRQFQRLFRSFRNTWNFRFWYDFN